MPDENLTEQVANDIRDLESSLQDLQNKVRMTDIRDRVEDLATSVNGLDRRIKSLRERGYAFEKKLEGRAADFEREWAKIAPGIQEQIESEARGLMRSLRPLERQITALAGDSDDPANLQPRVEALKSQVETLENRVEAAEGSIQGMYDRFSGEVRQMESHLDDLAWMMTELSEASFELLATESGIRATKAVWARGGEVQKDDPEGVLYLTDQRLLFEQKEKVTTKKVLFIPTEKELVQELLWDVPVALVEDTQTRKEGLFKNKQFIEIRFASAAPFNKTHLRIWQPAELWTALLKRARAREFDATRAIKVDEDVAQRVKDAPTKCTSCGGILEQEILRGMETITCEYCGTVIRL